MKPSIVDTGKSVTKIIPFEVKTNESFKQKKKSFDDILYELIEKEEAGLDEVAQNIFDRLCQCESKCFECKLINACLT